MTARQPNWRLSAACRAADPELFFPMSATAQSRNEIAQAKAICAACPVRPECLEFAVTTRQRHGIWGSLTEDERLPHEHSPAIGGPPATRNHACGIAESASTPARPVSLG